jgi:hypothetical protein
MSGTPRPPESEAGHLKTECGNRRLRRNIPPSRSWSARMLSCPVCSDSSSLLLCTVMEMPLIGCQFAELHAEALRATRGTLELTLCKGCGRIYNRAFEPDRVAYGPGYDSALSFSSRHRAELNATERLICSYALHGYSVGEFGCGAAEFLAALCAKGGNHGLGYDRRSRTVLSELRMVRSGSAPRTINPSTWCARSMCSSIWGNWGSTQFLSVPFNVQRYRGEPRVVAGSPEQVVPLLSEDVDGMHRSSVCPPPQYKST